MESWKTFLEEAMADHNETFEDIVSNTMTDEEMEKEFDPGYGGEEGRHFTVWTKSRVYFPVCYDGAEWAESVSRDPDGIPTAHVGGG